MQWGKYSVKEVEDLAAVGAVLVDGAVTGKAKL
jgi:hypothetical protein